MLECQNICFCSEGGQPIFDDFSAKFPRSGLIVITGPNGSGKSTLAQIIMGVKRPKSGLVLLNGEDITSKTVTERAKLGLAYAFQQPVKIKGISVFELLDIALGGGNEPKTVSKYLKTVGLAPEKYLNREIDGSLSGGEMKRIEIASVLARKARISVFDEPEAGIDLWSFNDLRKVFLKFRQNNPDSLVIIISHQEKILEIADTIMMLDGGKIVKQGKPEVVLPSLKAGKHGIQ